MEIQITETFKLKKGGTGTFLRGKIHIVVCMYACEQKIILRYEYYLCPHK